MIVKKWQMVEHKKELTVSCHVPFFSVLTAFNESMSPTFREVMNNFSIVHHSFRPENAGKEHIVYEVAT